MSRDVSLLNSSFSTHDWAHRLSDKLEFNFQSSKLVLQKYTIHRIDFTHMYTIELTFLHN